MGVGFLDILKEIRYIQNLVEHAESREELLKTLEDRASFWEWRIGISFAQKRAFDLMKEAEKEGDSDRVINNRLLYLQAKKRAQGDRTRVIQGLSV